MIALLKNWRYQTLMIIAFIAIVGILSVPHSNENWWMTLITSKVIGFCAAFAYTKLFLKWSKDGKLPELEQLIKED